MFAYLLKLSKVQTFLTNGPVQNCHLPLLQTQIQATQFQMLMTSSFPTITNQPIVGQTGIVLIQKLQSVSYSEIQVF
ncbi:Uncharacterised protein [Streptococcus pneumoniae]|nr:Uncharacterised protein [Streptococcus pneumoniae]